MSAKTLPRLTRERLAKEESGGKGEGWHRLLLKGYLPEEISIHTEPFATRHDIIHRVRELARRKSLPLPVSCAPKREVVERPSVEDWRAAFRTNVMRTGMVLALTQPMLELLCATAEDVLWDRFGQSSGAKPGCDLSTGRALEKRGLVELKSREEIYGSPREEPYSSHWKLTEAGEAVVALLKSVGVFLEADRAIQKKGDRR